jgi:hypothetical protein
VPEGSVLAATLYSLCTRVAFQNPGVHLDLFADDTCVCVCVCVYMQETVKRSKFSESLNAASLKLRRGMSAGTKIN